MPPSSSSRGKRPTSAPMKKLFLGALVGGALLLLTVVGLLLLPAHQQVAATPERPSPQERLEKALQAGEPTFVFMHSLTCASCQKMMGIVTQVAPEFTDAVTIIDVDVDDARNIPLLRREHLEMIPTEVFYDRQGRRHVYVGVMQPEQLRSVLRGILQ